MDSKANEFVKKQMELNKLREEMNFRGLAYIDGDGTLQFKTSKIERRLIGQLVAFLCDRYRLEADGKDRYGVE